MSELHWLTLEHLTGIQKALGQTQARSRVCFWVGNDSMWTIGPFFEYCSEVVHILTNSTSTTTIMLKYTSDSSLLVTLCWLYIYHSNGF